MWVFSFDLKQWARVVTTGTTYITTHVGTASSTTVPAAVLAGMESRSTIGSIPYLETWAVSLASIWRTATKLDARLASICLLYLLVALLVRQARLILLEIRTRLVQFVPQDSIRTTRHPCFARLAGLDTSRFGQLELLYLRCRYF